MRRGRKRPGALRELQGAGKKWDTDAPFVATPHRFVNYLLFRTESIAGLLLAGGWADRLALWIPLLDLAARMLRDVVGGRI